MARGKTRAETQIDNGSSSGEGHFVQADGSVGMGGPLRMGGNSIKGVPLPVSGTDAASKDYVDSVVGGGSGGGASGRVDHLFSLKGTVPESGTAYLFVGDVSTFDAPLDVDVAGSMSGASLSVDLADAANPYLLEILLNGAVAESLSLPVGEVSSRSSGFSASVSPGDKVSLRLRRVSGSGRSSFRGTTVYLKFTEG